jgi:hypothetical protein
MNRSSGEPRSNVPFHEYGPTVTSVGLFFCPGADYSPAALRVATFFSAIREWSALNPLIAEKHL